MKTREWNGKKLSLTTDGNLSILFTGVGSAFSKKNYQNNLLVMKGNDHVLIDCGTKCTQSLHELGLSVADIKTYLITHSHADHIGGLEEAAMIGRYVVHKRPRIIISEVYQKILWEMSLMGGQAYGEGTGGTLLSFEDFWEPLRPRDMKNAPRAMMEYDLGGINLKMFRTRHIPDMCATWENSFWSCGVLIDNRVLFTSDTQFDLDLIMTMEELYHPEAVFHDCQLYPGGVHAFIDEVATLPAEIKAKTWLMHYGDNFEQYTDKVKEYGFLGYARQHLFYDCE